MTILEELEKQVNDNPVLLYMKGSPDAPQCGFSSKTSQILIECGKPFSFVDILTNPEIRANLITEGIKELRPLTNKRICGYGNSEKIEITNKDRSDRPEEDHWSAATAINEREYTEEVQGWVKEGATIVAGCCRTRPSHIKNMAEAFQANI